MKSKIRNIIRFNFVTYLSFLYLFYFIKLSIAQEPLSLLVINQIRGNESCCSAGSISMISQISEKESLSNLPMGWALRFDALQNDEFIKELTPVPKNFSLGVLLEITPRLASESGVFYQGKEFGDDWKFSNNAFLVGYSQDSRKKLIDKVFARFYDRFHFYPSFTVSWIIDAWSLNYLKEKYGVVLHEITKEQYETDNLTLYGGIFNLPYFPSLRHPLIPGEDNHLDLLIARQTVSDIENNYGSYQSYYTSQPNDYLKNPEKTDFSYFVKLLADAGKQEENSRFALIGLENSLEWEKYHDEYLRQLDFVAQKAASGDYKVMTPFEYYNSYKNQNNPPITLLKSSSFPQSGTVWLFSNKYRVRLEIWDGKLVLTDFRIYGTENDPYQDSPAQVNRAYWIIPYAIDSSQQFEVINEGNGLYRGNPVRQDKGVRRFGIYLSQNKIASIKRENDNVLIIDETGSVIRFGQDFLKIENGEVLFGDPINRRLNEIMLSGMTQFYTFESHPKFFLEPKKEQNLVNLGWESDGEKIPMLLISKDNNSTVFTPNISLSQKQIDTLAPIFQPDRSTFKFDSFFSTFYWHNTQAIAGRNPVRLFIDPRNKLKRPISLTSLVIRQAGNPPVLVTQPENIYSLIEPFYVDFTATDSATSAISLTADGNIIAGETTIRFYSDCSKKVTYCLQNRGELAGFTKVILQEKYSQYLENLRQLGRIIKDKVSTLITKYLQLKVNI